MMQWKSKLGGCFFFLGLLSLLPLVANAQCYYPNQQQRNYCPQPCKPYCPPRCNQYTPPRSASYTPCQTNSCCNQSCDLNGIEFGADFIWWKPCIDDVEFANVSNETTDVNITRTDIKYHTVCPDWQPGVRGYISIPSQCKDWSFRGSYTWLHSNDTRSASQGDNTGIENQLLRPELDFDFSVVRSHWESTYHNFDAVLAYEFDGCGCQSFTPFFGVGGLILDQKLKTVSDDPNLTSTDTANTKWDSDFWGIGLTVGSEYAYTFCDGFDLFGAAKATLVAGEADTHNTQELISGTTTAETVQKFRNSKPCHLIPGYHLAAGFSYSPQNCGCGLNYGIRIGYEFVRWHNVPNPRVWMNEDYFLSTNPSVGSFGLHGLFAGLDLQF